MTESRHGISIEVRHFAGCPNAADAVALIHACIARLGVAADVIELDGDYPSPTVLVNGRDVMGDPGTSGRACRCDLPTEERVLDALRAAQRDVSGAAVS